MEILAANATIRTALNFSNPAWGSESQAQRLNQIADMVGQIQPKLSDEAFTITQLDPELMSDLINLYANEKTVENTFSRLSNLAQLEAMRSQNETMHSIKTLINSQTDILKAMQDMSEFQHKTLLSQQAAEDLQRETRQWAGRFSLVAAAIAVILSTSALFAALAAIPMTSSRWELFSAGNLALTFVAGGATISFLLIIAREGVKNVASGWKMSSALGVVVLALGQGLFWHFSRKPLGLKNVLGLGALLLLSAGFATLYLRGQEKHRSR